MGRIEEIVERQVRQLARHTARTLKEMIRLSQKFSDVFVAEFVKEVRRGEGKEES